MNLLYKRCHLCSVGKLRLAVWLTLGTFDSQGFFNMTGKTYLIVGGSKGIGLGLVRRLAAGVNRVVVLSRSAGELVGHPDVTHVGFDAINDEVPTEQLPDSIHGLAYCPGSLNLRGFKGLKPETFREDFEVNVVGAIRVLQACLTALKSGAQESSSTSSVLLFSTVACGQGMFAHASIAASKGAVEGLTRTLAAELSPQIRVNCLAPALTHTSMTEKFFSDPEKIAAMGEKYPLGRPGTVEDLASTGCFLLGPESSWITGQVIGVDGGMSTIRK
jgi:3-oxoacyl-[acyl-carrier protein] reductase